MSNESASAPAAVSGLPRNSRLLDTVREEIRKRHYSRRTEEAYIGWIRRFILFHEKRHPSAMGEAEVSRFLTHLAVEGRVSASTQNQALSALLFLYRDVLGRELDWLSGVVRAKVPHRLPVVLSRSEVRALLGHLEGVPGIVGVVLYGSGMRLLEAMRLRVKDVDFESNQIIVRRGKGQKDRVTILPERVKPALRQQLESARTQHHNDLERGAGWVELPEALGPEVSARGKGMGLAVGVPGHSALL